MHYLLAGKKLSTSTCNQILTGIHCFYRSGFSREINL